MNANVEDIEQCALLLGTLFLERPALPHCKEIIRGLAAMKLAEEWPWGTAEDLHAVSEELARTGRADIHETDRAYHRLFVGPRKLAAPPWGSVYLDSEAVVFGDSCLAISRWMRAQGIELHEAESREPIDHIGRMLALLSWLASNRPELVGEFLDQHLLPWAPTYLEKLNSAAEGSFYQALAHLTAITLASIENELAGTPLS